MNCEHDEYQAVWNKELFLEVLEV